MIEKNKESAEKNKPGPKEDRLKIDIPWEKAIDKALRTPPPEKDTPPQTT